MKEQKQIRVVAIANGFDGVALREPGDEFTMPADVMTAKVDGGQVIAPTWFKPVGAERRPAAVEDLA